MTEHTDTNEPTYCECDAGPELRSYTGATCKDCGLPSWSYTQGEADTVEHIAAWLEGNRMLDWLTLADVIRRGDWKTDD